MATARIPGIYFETVAPPVPALLPRMDIAAFAGFLPSGPIGLPFAVEDSTRFQEIFGTDLPLAWDSASGQMLLAQTPPSVRAFFRNGGKRCWILRLAKDAVSNAWIIPGLLQINPSGNYEAGWVQARSEGSWSDSLLVNAALLESPLPPGALDPGQSTPQVSGLDPGDTVQLYYEATETWAYCPSSSNQWFWFQSVQPGDIAPCGSPPSLIQPDSVTLLDTGVSQQIPFLNFCAQGNRLLLEVGRDTALSAPPGSWLRMVLSGRTLLMQVESMESAAVAGLASPLGSELAYLVSTRAWWVLDPTKAWADNRSNPVQATTVEFELWAMPPDATTLRVANLGFDPQHPRYWGMLPTDLILYTPQTVPAPLPYAALSADIDHPRFPLAGGLPGGAGLPLGMTGLVRSDFSQSPSASGANGAIASLRRQSGPVTPLERDGLASFDFLSLFGDIILDHSNSTTLISDAFAMQYQSQSPTQPGGLFALLSIDEPSMLAVPEATLNGWIRNPVGSSILSPPDPLLVTPADAAGHYTVSWSHVTGASGYRLQESSDVTFSSNVTAIDAGLSFSHTFVNLPQCPQQLYYRASACGTAGSGPWSQTGSVALGTGEFFACASLPFNSPQLLIIEEPNRVRLEWIPAAGGFDGFTLQIAEDAQFVSGATLFQGNETSFAYWKVPGPSAYFRANAQRGGASSAWSNTKNTTPVPVSQWLVRQDATAPLMLSIHASMLRIAAARGDMVAILSLPVSYHIPEATAYPAQLVTVVQATDPIRILSYGAVYHPWQVMRDSTAPVPLSLRTVPPDGAVCGAIASTTLKSGAWIAPANVSLANVVDLEPVLGADAVWDFDASQINIIVQAPEGFLIMGQDTLVTVAPEVIPLNVRRLLILIRRLALREGVRYVFENVSPTFQKQVTRQFESWMQQLLGRGAFAGLSAKDSYQVIADATVNPQTSIDEGRFIVQLRVAPSVPMRFLTVQLTQSDGQLSLMES